MILYTHVWYTNLISMSGNKSNKRKRTDLIMVRVTPEEKQLISATALNIGMTAPSLLRNLAINHRVVPIIDKKSIEEMLKVNMKLDEAISVATSWIGRLEFFNASDSAEKVKKLVGNIEKVREDLKAKILSIDT